MAKIRKKEKINKSKWDENVEECDFCTFFQSRDWHELWAEVYGVEWKANAYKISFDDGCDIVIPVTERSGIFGKTFLSSPEGTYGGAVYNDKEVTVEHIKKSVDALGGRVTLRENPFDENLNLENSYNVFTKYDFTQSVGVNRNWGTLKSNLSKEDVVRRKEKAEKKGLVFKKEKLSEDILDSYYKIYQKCRKKWGESASNNYSREAFSKISSIKNKTDIWVVRYKDKIICCGPIFKQNKFHAVSWLTLADPDHLDKNPYDFIYYVMIKNYNSEGFSYFDFNPSGGHEGVVKFKEKFDTEKKTSRVLEKDSPLGRVAQKARGVIGQWKRRLR